MCIRDSPKTAHHHRLCIDRLRGIYANVRSISTKYDNPQQALKEEVNTPLKPRAGRAAGGRLRRGGVQARRVQVAPVALLGRGHPK